MTHPDALFWAKVIAWVATVLCALLSARSATVFARNNTRVFTILALFSFNWALLVPYYSESSPSELLAGFAGFMLAYIGVLLRRQAKNLQPGPSTDDAVAPGDRVALSLLGLLIAPSLISLPVPQGTFNLPSRMYTEPVISSLITLIGYYSVLSALWIYSGRRNWLWLMAAISVVYTGYEVTFTGKLLYHLYTIPCTPVATTSPCSTDYWRNGVSSMSQEFLIGFAALKLIYSSLFVYLVLDKSLSPEDRTLKPVDKLIKLIWN